MVSTCSLAERGIVERRGRPLSSRSLSADAPGVILIGDQAEAKATTLENLAQGLKEGRFRKHQSKISHKYI